jgi:hypothetical protein
VHAARFRRVAHYIRAGRFNDFSVFVDEFFLWLEAADQLDADGVSFALVFR